MKSVNLFHFLAQSYEYIMSADNIGAKLVGGNKRIARAQLKCRHCMGTADEIACNVSIKIHTCFCFNRYSNRLKCSAANCKSKFYLVSPKLYMQPILLQVWNQFTTFLQYCMQYITGTVL